MIPFSVTILGSSSATPVYQRNPSAQILNVNHNYILLDAGEGVQTQLAKYHLKPSRISHILITHLHGDHFLGLPGLLSTLSLHGRTEPISLCGPSELKPFLEHYFSISDTHISFPIEFSAVPPLQQSQLIDTPHFTITSFPLKHRVPCTGFIIKEKSPRRKINKEACAALELFVDAYARLKDGLDVIDANGQQHTNESLTLPPPAPRSYAYCTDTIFDIELAPLFVGIDLLYHEATFKNDRAERATETYHCTAEQAAQIAKEAGVKKLIIGHFSSRYKELEGHLEEAKPIFENTALAIEGITFEV